MIEDVIYRVRPKNGDKRLRVFRILMEIDESDSSSFREQHNSVLEYFGRVFPSGYFVNSYERHVIDYSVIKEPGMISYHYHVFEHFSHNYLAQYLTSSENLEN